MTGYGPGIFNWNRIIRRGSTGPLFSEQASLEKHRHYRDVVAPLESALAKHLSDAGYQVLGKHPKARPVNTTLFKRVLSLLDGRL